jgi:hypothetical protein
MCANATNLKILPVPVPHVFDTVPSAEYGAVQDYLKTVCFQLEIFKDWVPVFVLG